MTYYPILYPEVSQHLFHVPKTFDDDSHMLSYVQLIQAPHHWYTDVCRHDITIGDPSPPDVLDWKTHRSPAGYWVAVARGIGRHRCDSTYDDLLVNRVMNALLQPHAERPNVTIEIEGRTTKRHLSIPEHALRRRRFARLVEDLVHTLAPDFYVTGIDFNARVAFDDDDDSGSTP